MSKSSLPADTVSVRLCASFLLVEEIMVTFKEIPVKKYALSKLQSNYVNAEWKGTVGLYAKEFFFVPTILQICIYVGAFKATGECRKLKVSFWTLKRITNIYIYMYV